jgi:hypothetical protein
VINASSSVKPVSRLAVNALQTQMIRKLCKHVSMIVLIAQKCAVLARSHAVFAKISAKRINIKRAKKHAENVKIHVINVWMHAKDVLQRA